MIDCLYFDDHDDSQLRAPAMANEGSDGPNFEAMATEHIATIRAFNSTLTNFGTLMLQQIEIIRRLTETIGQHAETIRANTEEWRRHRSDEDWKGDGD